MEEFGMPMNWALCLDISTHRILPVEQLIEAYPLTMQALGYRMKRNSNGHIAWIEMPTVNAMRRAASILEDYLEGEEGENLTELNSLPFHFVEAPDSSTSRYLQRELLGAFLGRKAFAADKGYLYAHDLTAHISQLFWPKEFAEAFAEIASFHIAKNPLTSSTVVAREYRNYAKMLKTTYEELLISQLDFTAATHTNVFAKTNKGLSESHLGLSFLTVFYRAFLSSRESVLEQVNSNPNAFIERNEEFSLALDEALSETEESSNMEKLRERYQNNSIVPVDYLYSTVGIAFFSGFGSQANVEGISNEMEKGILLMPSYIDPQQLPKINSLLSANPEKVGEMILNRRKELEERAALALESVRYVE